MVLKTEIERIARNRLINCQKNSRPGKTMVILNDEKILDLLKNSRIITVVGISTDPGFLIFI